MSQLERRTRTPSCKRTHVNATSVFVYCQYTKTCRKSSDLTYCITIAGCATVSSVAGAREAVDTIMTGSVHTGVAGTFVCFIYNSITCELIYRGKSTCSRWICVTVHHDPDMKQIWDACMPNVCMVRMMTYMRRRFRSSQLNRCRCSCWQRRCSCHGYTESWRIRLSDLYH